MLLLVSYIATTETRGLSLFVISITVVSWPALRIPWVLFITAVVNVTATLGGCAVFVCGFANMLMLFLVLEFSDIFTSESLGKSRLVSVAITFRSALSVVLQSKVEITIWDNENRKNLPHLVDNIVREAFHSIESQSSRPRFRCRPLLGRAFPCRLPRSNLRR